MQGRNLKYVYNSVVRFYQLLLCVLVLTFSTASKASSLPYSPALPARDVIARQSLICNAQAAPLFERCRDRVNHPRRAPHLIRRRETPTGAFKDSTLSYFTTKVNAQKHIDRVTYYSYSCFFRPFYYIFLFRNALF